MKIFWQDSQGLFPPDDASFAWIRFGENFIHTISSWEKITTLPDPIEKIPVKNVIFTPSYDIWEQNVLGTLSKIEKNLLQKAVLARTCQIECYDEIDPLKVLAKLKKISQNSLNFCFLDGKTAFLGSTPETLFTKNERQLQSEALAGTIKKSIKKIENQRLEQMLLQNPKTQKEVNLVLSYIKQKLSPLCETIDHLPLHIKQTPFVQHLCFSIYALLKTNTSWQDLIHALHPTPAVCGEPKEKALNWIQQIENFSRDLYSASLGWYTEKNADFKVALRCCKIDGKTATFYTGAGIVLGSDPKQEWIELDDKLKIFKEIFQFQ